MSRRRVDTPAPIGEAGREARRAEGRQRMNRSDWLSILAKAPRAGLEAALAGCHRGGIAWPRPAETAMVMLEGRAGGGGQRFSLGQATVTRATAERNGVIGVGYVQGHDPPRAELMAVADIALQEGAADLLGAFVVQEGARQRARRADRARAAAATKVEFFTLAREGGGGSD